MISEISFSYLKWKITPKLIHVIFSYIHASQNRWKGRPVKTKNGIKKLKNTLDDADNLDYFEEICINTTIDTISATIASTSKNSV